MDKKKEKEQKEMFGELKSALKEGIATLKSQVCETARIKACLIKHCCNTKEHLNLCL